MRSFKNFFLLMLIFLPATAYVDKDTQPGVALSPGSKAPEIKITDSRNELLSSMRGHYVLLQFWATYDATSRMNHLLLHNSISRHYADRVRNVSISFDADKVIFEETLRADGIHSSDQYLVSEGTGSKIFRNYRLSNGYGNYLIDPSGIIIAKNITPAKLANLVK